MKASESTVLADAIRELSDEQLLRAFERGDLTSEARQLVRGELLRRLGAVGK